MCGSFAMLRKAFQQVILFWLAVIGVVFYVVQPILFPDVPSHPELLPVYTLMFGISKAIKGDDKRNEDNGSSDE